MMMMIEWTYLIWMSLCRPFPVDRCLGQSKRCSYTMERHRLRTLFTYKTIHYKTIQKQCNTLYDRLLREKIYYVFIHNVPCKSLSMNALYAHVCTSYVNAHMQAYIYPCINSRIKF